MDKRKQTRKVFLAQVLNSLISGILQIVIPLLMIERNIDLVTIGFVFAATPIVFQLLRVMFGAISDIIGRKLFFVINSVMNIIVLLIYLVASTPMEYLFGKVIEGVKGASLWSVNRAYILDYRKEKRKSLVKLIGINHVASAIGSMIAGYLIFWLAYENTIMFCMFLAMGLVLSVATLKDKRRGKLVIKDVFNVLDFRKKSKLFKKFTVLTFLTGLTMGLTAGYIFPVFLQQNGFTTDMIGLIIGFNVLLVGVFSYLTRKIEIRKLVLYGGILYTLSLFFLGLSSNLLAAIMIIVVGATKGIHHGVFEGIISKVSRVKSYGGDVGILTIGLHLGRSASLAFSGLLITYIDFFGIFTLASLLYLVFFISAYSALEK